MTHNIKYIYCECHSSEHTLRLAYFEEDPDTMFVETHLRKKVWWKRIWIAIRYVFGYQTKYGSFDEYAWSSKEVDQFVTHCQEWQKKQ